MPDNQSFTIIVHLCIWQARITDAFSISSRQLNSCSHNDITQHAATLTRRGWHSVTQACHLDDKQVNGHQTQLQANCHRTYAICTYIHCTALQLQTDGWFWWSYTVMVHVKMLQELNTKQLRYTLRVLLRICSMYNQQSIFVTKYSVTATARILYEQEKNYKMKPNASQQTWKIRGNLHNK